MAKYLIRSNYWDGAALHTADAKHPATLTLSDTAIPSRTWEPLDEPARLALIKLFEGDQKKAAERLEKHKATPGIFAGQLERAEQALARLQAGHLAKEPEARKSPEEPADWKAGLVKERSKKG